MTFLYMGVLMRYIIVRINDTHWMKNHISQVLEYHEKFKNTRKISTFHHLFRSKTDGISYLWKVQNKNFSVLKKTWYSMLKKKSSYTNFLNEKKTVFRISEKFKTRTFSWYELLRFVQNSCFCNNFFFSFIGTYVSFNHFKDLLNLHYEMKCEVKFKNFSSLNGYSMK